jgi:hypothetical protein
MKYPVLCLGLLMVLVILPVGCMTTQPYQMPPATKVSSPITNGIVNPLLARTAIQREDPIVGQWYLRGLGWTTGFGDPGTIFFSFHSSGNYQTNWTYRDCNLEKGCGDLRTDIQYGVWRANGNNTYTLTNHSRPLIFFPENDTMRWYSPETPGISTGYMTFNRYRAHDPIIGQWYSPPKSRGEELVYYNFKFSGRYNSSYTWHPASGDPVSIQKYGIWRLIGHNKYALSDLSGRGESSDPLVYFPENDTITRAGITLNRSFRDNPPPPFSDPSDDYTSPDIMFSKYVPSGNRIPI